MEIRDEWLSELSRSKSLDEVNRLSELIKRLNFSISLDMKFLK